MGHTTNPAALSRRTFLGRSLATVGVVAGAGALLEACGANSTGKTTLSVMYPANELSKAQVAAFQQLHPDITVNFITYDDTRLAASIAAGSPPDIVRVGGAPAVPNLAVRGVAADLSHYFANSSVLKESDLQPINDVYRFDGKTQGHGPRYGMAKDWSPDLQMWYNKTLFDQAGVPYPSATVPMTYDELLDLGKKLTQRDSSGKIKVYGLDADWIGAISIQGYLLQMVAQQGGSIYNSDYTKADFSTPEVRKALQWYVDWAQAHVGPSPLDPDPGGWSWPPFDANRLAIAMYGYWFGGQISSDPKLTNVGLAPAPLMGPTRISSCVSGTGAFIPAGAKNKDAAWKFMEYYMGGQPAIDRAKTGFGVPALKSLLPDLPQTLPYQQEAYQSLQNELPYFKVAHFSPYASSGAVDGAIVSAILPVMQGQQSLDAGIKQLNSSVNLLIQQGQQQA